MGTGVLLHFKNRKRDPELAEEAMDGSVAKAFVLIFVIVMVVIFIGLITSSNDDDYNSYSNSAVYDLNGIK